MKPDADSYHFLQGSALPGRGSITQHVTDVLRHAIVTLAFRPGEVLDKGLICERLGVSRFPVSEALARLPAEGLVDILPQRGTSVSLVRVADVLEHMLIRRAIEAEAVRAARRHTPIPSWSTSSTAASTSSAQPPRTRTATASTSSTSNSTTCCSRRCAFPRSRA